VQLENIILEETVLLFQPVNNCNITPSLLLINIVYERLKAIFFIETGLET